jgi:hypothetical protein
MITILGIKVSYEALAFFALFIGSEIIGASKLRENSIVQVLLDSRVTTQISDLAAAIP